MKLSFEEAVLPHYDTYINIATKMCHGDRHMAEDMVQEAMVKALVYYSEFDESYKITTWFHKILHNTIMDAYKIEGRAKNRYYDYFVWKGLQDPFYSIDISDEEDLHQELLNKIPDIIGTLSPMNQTIIKMYMAGEQQLNIGKAVGLTRIATNARIRMICKRIHDDLVDKHAELR